MESQLSLAGFQVDSPVGAGGTPLLEAQTDSLSFKERAGEGMGEDFSTMPESWCQFAELNAKDFPKVPEPAFPPPALRFAAFHRTLPGDCRVVIVGQDPYHAVGQAQGLAFSVPPAVSAPPSLKNILKELASDLEASALRTHDLTDWAANGVLLINTILSVAPGLPASHRQLGWQAVTSRVVRALGQDDTPRVFMLWGNEAMNFRPLIDERKNLVLASSHPSPMGNACRRPSGDAPAFFGSRPFSRANEWLVAHGRAPVRW